MTKELFKEDVYLKKAEAKITSISHTDGDTLITLDQTIFFPTGGGQSCDRGTIDEFEVVDVYNYTGILYHRLSRSDCDFSVGDTVSLTLNWAHRFDNMQRHCGEHILSGIFHREFGGVNRGFHMGEEYMTIDISLEDNPDFEVLTWDMAKIAEKGANEVIWENLPVVTRHFDTQEEAVGLPLRKELVLEEDITIVSIGSSENPSDCVACCGTHPSFTGQVGIVKIYKVEPNKGMYRVFFEAGQRAYLNYVSQYDILSELSNKLSAGTDDLIKKFDTQQKKQNDVRAEFSRLKKVFIAKEVSDIRSRMRGFFVAKYDELSVDDLLRLGSQLEDQIVNLMFLVHVPSNTVLLFSADGEKYDCGKLVKDNSHIYSGKGGGNKNSARAIFPKGEYVDVFIDLIEKHLK